jgi:hypothetical protein
MRHGLPFLIAAVVAALAASGAFAPRTAALGWRTGTSTAGLPTDAR